MQKEKYAKRKIKAKRIKKKALKYDWKLVSRRCESYKMYFKGDSSHQMAMIVMWVFMIFS